MSRSWLWLLLITSRLSLCNTISTAGISCDDTAGAVAEIEGGAASASRFAYMVMIGPLGKGHEPWLLAAIALFSALRRLGSTADFVLLCAVRDRSSPRLSPAELKRLLEHGIRARIVHAPLGIGSFHMGSHKLWAWQHTEYDRIQLLDADLMPLANMDRCLVRRCPLCVHQVYRFSKPTSLQ